MVHRSTTIKGLNKAYAQKQLILYEDFYEEERKAFNDKNTLLEELEDGRKSKKYVDEVKSALLKRGKSKKTPLLRKLMIGLTRRLPI